MKRIKIEDWVPVDGLKLEKAAMEVIKLPGNFLVVAGPGSGKTELLAQKACFLLQTNQCRYPRRILAISFKRDAAYNLKERVVLRCGVDLAVRFDSLTFDSFAKLLLDHFLSVLEEPLKTDKEYKVLLDDRSILPYYESVDINFRFTHTDKELLLLHTASSLPFDNDSLNARVIRSTWNAMLQSKPSELTFKMIMRLAEYIVARNDKIRIFLQQTYSHVFLDEFQDATSIQYEFFKSCFLGSNCQVTAVGDDKQRIMLWAGAQESVFEYYQEELGAVKKHLVMNFRSAPRLVALLNHLTEHLLGKSDFAQADNAKGVDGGECFLWLYDTPKSEMDSLFTTVREWLSAGQIKERDICILVKHSLATYVGDLIAHFNNNGISARDETVLQDLIAQDLVQYLVHTLYVIFDKRWGESKRISLAFLSNIQTEMADAQLLALEVTYSKFIKLAQRKYKTVHQENLEDIVAALVSFADKDRIASAYPIYKSTAFLDATVSDFSREFKKVYQQDQGIVRALNSFVGENTIPVMTVHKSKGLEYHTVIFVGLEDGAFWSYREQPDEDKCTFFVALSRAKQRVVFTFSRSRPDKYGRMRYPSFEPIEEIFNELQNSGLVIMQEK
jgi:DNA helicase II / ATP-dependent DNA helicase PcrA